MKKDENTGKSFVMEGRFYRIKRFTKCSGKYKHIDDVPLYYIILECKYTGEIAIEGKVNEMVNKETISIKR